MLDLKGIDQIKSIGYRLINTKEDFRKYKLISSPMIRTQHSMQIIKEVLNLTDVEVILEPLIQEIDRGECTNMYKKIIERDYADLLKTMEEDYWNFRFPKGESSQEVYDRIVKFYEKYKNEENLIVIGHGISVKMLKNILMGSPKDDIINDKINQNYFFAWDGKKMEKL